MDYPELTSKKSLKVRIQELITQFFSLFIKKEKVLNAAPEELTQELNEVNEKYNELIIEDTFSKIKDTYDTYKVGVNPEGGLIAIEKATGYVKDDAKFVSRVRFASLWRKSAFGDFDIKDEENCYKECFSDESEKIYNSLKEIIGTQLKNTGNVDTKMVLDEMKDGEEKWSRITSRRLFRTPAYSETVSDYFRSITSASKKQTKPTLSLSQALYGVDEF